MLTKYEEASWLFNWALPEMCGYMRDSWITEASEAFISELLASGVQICG